jgi:hypothetical protein
MPINAGPEEHSFSRRHRCFVSAHLLFLALATAGSAQTVVPDTTGYEQIFFESSQSYRQTVPLMGETEIVVESSLPDSSVVVRRGGSSNVTLDVTGRYSITGYYGLRENAGVQELAGPELAFRIARGPIRLSLSSPEWIWLHHDLFVEQLTITVPDDVLVTLRRLLVPDDLYGRR